MTRYCSSIQSPIGTLTLVASDVGLQMVNWPEPGATSAADRGEPVDATAARHPPTQRDDSHPHLASAAAQLDEYFAGTRRRFELALDPIGTAFQRAAWLALQEIPFGETWTYGQQAEFMGRPKASRAVGAANGRNPLPIIVPCHRVIGADGSLTGFTGGIDIKRRLLDLEAPNQRLVQLW